VGKMMKESPVDVRIVNASNSTIDEGKRGYGISNLFLVSFAEKKLVMP